MTKNQTIPVMPAQAGIQGWGFGMTCNLFLHLQRHPNRLSLIGEGKRFVDLGKGKCVRDDLVKRINMLTTGKKVDRPRQYPWLVDGDATNRLRTTDNRTGVKVGREARSDVAYPEIATRLAQQTYALLHYSRCADQLCHHLCTLSTSSVEHDLSSFLFSHFVNVDYHVRAESLGQFQTRGELIKDNHLSCAHVFGDSRGIEP